MDFDENEMDGSETENGDDPRSSKEDANLILTKHSGIYLIFKLYIYSIAMYKDAMLCYVYVNVLLSDSKVWTLIALP